MIPKTHVAWHLGLAIAAVLLTGAPSAAQTSPTGGGLIDPGAVDHPPQLPTRVTGSGTRQAPGQAAPAAPEVILPGAVFEPIEAGYDDPTAYDLSGAGYADPGCQDCQSDLLHGYPAVVESSGTWLQRGFWYVEADAVVYNRYWDRRDLILATDDSQTDNPFAVPIASNVSVALPPTLAPTNRLLYLKGRHPGADGSVRVSLGRFLFRDCENRDHKAEFTAFGGGDFVHDCGITPREGFVLFVPFKLDGTNLNDSSVSFDGSTSQRAVYTSRFKNFEANYRVKRRMGKDQMVLMPSGEWIRRASTTWTREFLVGMRFFDLAERFDWTAQDVIIPAASGGGTADGSLLIRTDNNLVGIQLGAGHAYEAARWSVSLLSKAGVYVNDAKSRQRYQLVNNPDLGFQTRTSEDQISFIGETRLTARWHVRPNLSLRGGYEALYVTSVALAPAQFNFDPVFSKIATSGDPFYHGVSFGLEGYW